MRPIAIKQFGAYLGVLVLVMPTHAAVIFGNNALANGSRWDAAARTVGSNERSLAGGLRYSLEGGAYQAYRDLFTWQGAAPSVPDFTNAIHQAFNAWTITDPASALGTDLSFVEDLASPVAGPSPNSGVNPNGAEIDLLAETDGVLWNPGDSSLRAETFFNTTSFTSLNLTSGTKNYPGFAISGADIKMNANPGALWNLTSFQTILTHEIGHAIGLGDVDTSGNFGRFIDDNYDGTTSATALATLTNSWAALVDPLNPAASPLAEFSVLNADPGVDTPGVDILMETNIPSILFGNPTPLQNDDFGGRQFLYPYITIISGDQDGDRFVGINDLNIVLGNWNQSVPPADPLADPSGDGFIGIVDLNIVLGNWNAGIPPGVPNAAANIPEPGTLAFFCLTGLGLLRRISFNPRAFNRQSVRGFRGVVCLARPQAAGLNEGGMCVA